MVNLLLVSLLRHFNRLFIALQVEADGQSLGGRVIPDREYQRQKELLEMELESLVSPAASRLSRML
jgi:hypothetical protein